MATRLFPVVVMACAAFLLIAGCGEEKDPVVELKEFVPRLEEALNGRDIGGLRRLGTANLEANRLIVDIFEGNGTGLVRLGFYRIRSLVSESGELVLKAVVEGDPDPDGWELILQMQRNGRWRIDAYAVVGRSDVPDSAGVSPQDGT